MNTPTLIDFSAPHPDEPLQALELVQANRGWFHPEFGQWLIDNWPIWRAFRAEADRISINRRHYSARTIGEYLRHQTAIAEKDSLYKINDHCWPDLARLWAAFRPEREGFFEFRGRKAA